MDDTEKSVGEYSKEILHRRPHVEPVLRVSKVGKGRPAEPYSKETPSRGRSPAAESITPDTDVSKDKGQAGEERFTGGPNVGLLANPYIYNL